MSESGGGPVETVTTLGPLVLEVHQAVLPATGSGPAPVLPVLTPYLPRPHDALLCEALVPPLEGGPSTLAVLTGGSSTGKTRSVYEALSDLAAHRPLLRPGSAAALLHLLTADRLAPGVVLWLDEAQRHLYGSDGEQAAAALLEALRSRRGVVAVGTLWTDPYWHDLTRRGQPGDPHSHARALLTAPVTHRIPVADTLTDDELGRWAELADQRTDGRLAAALAAGGADGRVVQHLTGGPELLAAYLHGPGDLFTPVEHALITAALDARRLGHRTPLPAALLADAADGSLSDRARPGEPDWAGNALTALSTGTRPDGTRTDVRCALSPLTSLRTRAGTPARYEPADYLDQHTRPLRADELGSPVLWEALVEHTTEPGDLHLLAHSAWRRGLYRQAVLLGRKATLAGSPDAPAALIRRLGTLEDPQVHHAADWVAAHADLTYPGAVTSLLQALNEAGAEQAVTVLLDRRPEARLDLTSAIDAAALLIAVAEAGGVPAVDPVVRRAEDEADLTDPVGAYLLIRTLQWVGADDAAATVALRSLAEADIGNLHQAADMLGALAGRDGGKAAEAMAYRVVVMVDFATFHDRALLTDVLAFATSRTSWALTELGFAQDPSTGHVVLRAPDEARAPDPREADAKLRAVLAKDRGDAVTALAHRILDAADLTDSENTGLLVRLLSAGADPVTETVVRRIEEEIDLGRPRHAVLLLSALRRAGLREAADRVALRAVDAADLTDPDGVARLLQEFRLEDRGELVPVLIGRRPEVHVALTDALGIARLLGEFRAQDAWEAVSVLLGRHPETHVRLTDGEGVTWLLEELCALGEGDAVSVLLSRHPEAHVSVTDGSGFYRLMKALLAAGGSRAVDTLARRVAAEADPSNPRMDDVLLWLRAEAADTLARRMAAHADLGEPHRVGRLLDRMLEAGAYEAADTLLSRILDAPLDPDVAVVVLPKLRGEAARTLARRAAEETPLTDPRVVASLVKALQSAGDAQALTLLLDRHPQHRAAPSSPYSVDRLLETLRGVGAHEAADTLTRRVRRAGYSTPVPAPRHGWEPDERPAAPWTWNDLPPLPGATAGR
ncbi:hypothetical protein [Streptomyces sp. V1I6]|uniref:hypothetical protein n=1 Tax=Streptomyces sp. V1I6 TaxID=3042273 RepID=UPI0027896F0E|nr:hypothetical protein [Streptomyces sp. V1I6]MDQ0847991.1 uncharacterized protein YidB (DUF937 family) [Streptomyces sp. V1I6]